MADNDWDSYFTAITRFLVESERQYGVCNSDFTEYALEQLKYIEVTCRVLIRTMATVPEMHLFLSNFLTCIRTLRSQWQEYSDRPLHHIGISCPYLHTGRPGRPHFDVNKDQVEYLWSLSFGWNEIAALIGISRTTLYRYA